MLVIRGRSRPTSRIIVLLVAVVAAVAVAFSVVSSSASANSSTSLIYDFHGQGSPFADASQPASAVASSSGRVLLNGQEIDMVCWTSVPNNFVYPLNYSTNKVFKVALSDFPETQYWVNASFVYYQQNVPAC